MSPNYPQITPKVCASTARRMAFLDACRVDESLS